MAGATQPIRERRSRHPGAADRYLHTAIVPYGTTESKAVPAGAQSDPTLPDRDSGRAGNLLPAAADELLSCRGLTVWTPWV
ncbi:hypothetical protein I545_5281 [Mycobacterium kansasii 662]|nr:hypothetical protein I545_5281 [Mycobacterium kansasii 662]OOK67069.1 hypothetical protein BZL29_7250 [Mycobacterium kansasii]